MHLLVLAAIVLNGAAPSNEEQFFRQISRFAIVREDILSPFLVELDSTVSTAIEVAVETLRVSETAQSAGKAKIRGAYAFRDLEDVLLCRLGFGGIVRIQSDDVFESILANRKDASVYHFGGDATAFARVLGANLKIFREAKKEFDLVRLYLNTLEIDHAYVLLTSLEDYRKEWEDYSEYYQRHPGPVPSLYEYRADEIEADIDKVSGLIHQAKVSRTDTRTEIETFSWRRSGGVLEKWTFVISDHEFDVSSRTKLIDKVGPLSRFPLID